VVPGPVGRATVDVRVRDADEEGLGAGTADVGGDQGAEAVAAPEGVIAPASVAPAALNLSFEYAEGVHRVSINHARRWVAVTSKTINHVRGIKVQSIINLDHSRRALEEVLAGV
jgi:hypothetical protein